jgi:hypothetical protein
MFGISNSHKTRSRNLHVYILHRCEWNQSPAPGAATVRTKGMKALSMMCMRHYGVQTYWHSAFGNWSPKCAKLVDGPTCIMVCFGVARGYVDATASLRLMLPRSSGHLPNPSAGYLSYAYCRLLGHYSACPLREPATYSHTILDAGF